MMGSKLLDENITGKDLLADRQRGYRTLFNETSGGHVVLDDLKKFCRGEESTFHPDARVAASLDGRREVYLRIIDFTELSLSDLCTKYGSNT